MKAGDLAYDFWSSCLEASEIIAMLFRVLWDTGEHVHHDLGRNRLINCGVLVLVARVRSNAAMSRIRPCHRSIIAHDDQPD